MDKRTFTFLGVRYNAPASLDENIRDWFARNAPTAACGITTANRKNKKNTVFPEKMCVFPCKFPEKYVPLQYQKEKEVTTIKTGGNCNSAPRL